MIATCDHCGTEYKTLPSWYKKSPRHFCNRSCYMEATKDARSKHINKIGVAHRYQLGHQPSPNRKMQKGTKHYAWKGDKVGYRGLHYWLRRVKGIPKKCTECGTAEKRIQWANVDGKYRRDPDDFIALCASCHKLYDLSMKSIRDAPSATE